MGPKPYQACFCKACKLGMVFLFFTWLRKKRKNQKNITLWIIWDINFINLTTSINQVLLEYSHDDLFRSSLWLLLSNTCRAEEVWETPPAKSKTFIPSGPLQRTSKCSLRNQKLSSTTVHLGLPQFRKTKPIPFSFCHIFNVFLLNERPEGSCHRQGWNWGLPRLSSPVGWDRASPETLVSLECALLPTIPHCTQWLTRSLPALHHEFDVSLS